MSTPEQRRSAEVSLQLTQIVSSPVLGQAVSTIADLGLADLIDDESDTPLADLAASTGCDERTLYRVMRFLASHGIFEEHAGRRFALTPMARALRSDVDNSFRPAARLFRGLYRGLHEFEHSLRTGKSALEKALGEPLFEYLETRPDEAGLFDAAMTAFHGTETPAMLDAYDFGGIQTLADIGGGNASLLIETLSRNPSLHGILFDLGHVAANGKSAIAHAGLESRCTVVEGSFFDSVPPGADAYLLRHIIHDWSDEDSVRILRNCRKVVPGNGRLLLVEAVIPPGNDPSPAKDMDMTMLLFPGGMERTEAEYGNLFNQAGFRLVSITPTASPVSIIEGRPG